MTAATLLAHAAHDHGTPWYRSVTLWVALVAAAAVAAVVVKALRPTAADKEMEARQRAISGRKRRRR